MKSRIYEDLSIFTRSLSTLYKAGIPILRALDTIKIGEANSYFNQAVKKIREKVQSGRSLSEAMADFPRIFPGIYVATVAAGEHSGKLDELLDSLGSMLEKDMELNRQIKSSTRYPLAVITAIAAAFIVIVTFVIPRFIQFYSKMGADLPLPTRLLIWINQFVSGYWLPIIAAIIISVFAFRKIYSTEAGRRFFDTKILSLPIFGDLVIKGNIARFAYIFQILLKSGIPVVSALEMLSEVVKNSRLTSEIRILATFFREGRDIKNLIKELRFFPEMALQMIVVGMESGAMENMLREIAIHYSKEVDYKSRHLTSLLEPILTVILGGFVLVVALAIFLPMWNLIQVFRG
jgi:MSHA biogenesis protein MshG